MLIEHDAYTRRAEALAAFTSERDTGSGLMEFEGHFDNFSLPQLSDPLRLQVLDWWQYVFSGLQCQGLGDQEIVGLAIQTIKTATGFFNYETELTFTPQAMEELTAMNRGDLYQWFVDGQSIFNYGYWWQSQDKERTILALPFPLWHKIPIPFSGGFLRPCFSGMVWVSQPEALEDLYELIGPKGYQYLERREIKDAVLGPVAEQVGTVLKKGGLVLDAGCGRGSLYQTLLDRGVDEASLKRLIGVDLVKDMARAARRLGGNILVGDLYHLPYPSETFSIATAVYVTHVLEDDLHGLFAEFGRVLTNNGEIIFNIRAPFELVDSTRTLERIDWYKEVLQQGGFSILKELIVRPPRQDWEDPSQTYETIIVLARKQRYI